jgi:AcrR family transcriptional regulator
MARPRSDDKRKAIMSAAIRVIATQGLGAATAVIAKEAGVSNGSLFIYFETKAHLLNQIYRELKAEVVVAALAGLPTEGDIRKQALYAWSHWLRWAASCPEKHRTLALLDLSEDITEESHQSVYLAFSGIRELLERVRKNGPMRDASPGFMVALMSALANATIDFMIHDPVNADKHCMAAFDAFWRMVA